jgi:hypothetical protein
MVQHKDSLLAQVGTLQIVAHPVHSTQYYVENRSALQPVIRSQSTGWSSVPVNCRAVDEPR